MESNDGENVDVSLNVPQLNNAEPVDTSDGTGDGDEGQTSLEMTEQPKSRGPANDSEKTNSNVENILTDLQSQSESQINGSNKEHSKSLLFVPHKGAGHNVSNITKRLKDNTTGPSIIGLNGSKPGSPGTKTRPGTPGGTRAKPGVFGTKNKAGLLARFTSVYPVKAFQNKFQRQESVEDVGVNTVPCTIWQLCVAS